MSDLVKANLGWTYGYRETPRSQPVNYGPGRGILVPGAWARAMGFEIVDESPEQPAPETQPEPYAEVEDALAVEWFVGLGFKQVAAEALVAEGYTSIAALAEARESDLLAIPGVGKAYLKKIQVALEA